MSQAPQDEALVIVLLRRPPDHPRTSQGLRAAIGYLGAGLRVRVVLCGPAVDVLARCGTDGPVALRRPVTMLRALGHEVVAMDEAALVTLPQLLAQAKSVVCW